MDYDKEILDKTGIFVFRNAVSPDLCDNIINNFNNDLKNQHEGKIYIGCNLLTDKKVKNTIDSYSIQEDYHVLSSVLHDAFNQIKSVREGISSYNIHYTPFQLQKNIKNEGYFNYHSDDNSFIPENPRVISPIFYLNDVKEGGETHFKYQDFSVKPETGKLVIFPCTWTYYHCGKIPISGDKYIITTFGYAYY